MYVFDGYHGNGASEMVLTILFLDVDDKTNNLRPFSLKSEHFLFFYPVVYKIFIFLPFWQ